MDFQQTDEQRLLIETALRFVEEELYPHEAEVERTGEVSPGLVEQIRRKSLEVGLYAAAMPAEIGGGGLDQLSMAMLDRALGRASYALHYLVHRPSNVLQACVGEQRERYLIPTIKGERVDCFAMTEPGAGSDVRGMKTRAERKGGADGSDWVINGTKHFISHVDLADYIILMAATGEEEGPRGARKKITTFLVDKDSPGLTVRKGYENVSMRGYHNFILDFDDCVVPHANVLGEVDKGFDVANEWLGATRLQVAAACLGRCDRALQLATEFAAERKQFGQSIGRFQGIGFKLADMQVQLQAAELLTYWASWKYDQGTMTDSDAAIAKLHATETLAMIADEALQIHGGMGLMNELPLEMIWRDARIERIWEGTSEIQRHIISRAMLRPLGS